MEKYVTVHGQELSPTNYAVCQADLLIKNDRQATVHLGNSLIPHDPHSKEPGDQWPESKWRFHRMLSNPPFGVTWGGKDGYEREARKLEQTRYRAGMPRVNDGALLFLQTMLAKMAPPEEGGSRIAIIFNGSPLSNGDCGSGESEIRRWILENDWLDAIVMLPDQLFYNTGIFTYIWLLRNDKPASHRGRVMLIDARQQYEKEPKSFGNKRNRITDAHRAWIEERYRKGWAKGYADEQVKIFPREDFAYHKVSVVFWQTDEHDQPAVVTEPYEKTFTAANVKKEQEFYASDLTFRVRVKAKGKEQTVEFTLKPKDNAAKTFKEALADAEEIALRRVDAPALRAGRRIHPARRGHRGVPETGNRQAHHPLEGNRERRQADPRLRNPAEQVLLPLPAAHARERPAGGVLAAGERGGEAAGGARRMKQKRDTNVLITAEYPQFADPAILAQVVPELAEKGVSAILGQPVPELALAGLASRTSRTAQDIDGSS